jgi:chorismate synthase
MEIEKDAVRILSGVRSGRTIGSPVSLCIENRDWENWNDVMAVDDTGGLRPEPETKPRPGHGDLAGMLKFDTRDARDVLERASARETAARVAAGALGRRLLEEVGMTVVSRVVSIAGVSAEIDDSVNESSFEGVDEDPLRCADHKASGKMMEEIDRAARDGDSVGGTFEIAAFGAPPGLGSPAQFDRRLDARICSALASIPGVKGVEVGKGFGLAGVRGSEAHDEIYYERARGVFRRTNRAGGLEAGMTNGEPVLLRAAMKPIPTLARPLATVDIERLEPAQAFKERADVCAVPAAAVVGEAVVALVLADAVLEKFGGDSMIELMRNHSGYLEQIKKLWKPGGQPA